MSAAPRVLSVVVLNDRREIGRLIRLVDDFGRSSGLVEDDTTDLNLLLDEFVSNVIKYGYDDGLEHRIDVSVQLEDRQLTVRIEDDGKPFNPLDVEDPDLNLPVEERGVGGLGILIAKTLADSFDYERKDGRNILTITKTTRG